MKKQVPEFIQMKVNKEKIVMVTAYDFPSAKLSEQAEVDMILVGDSLGMVVLGYESTVPVTLDDMIHHTKAVKRGAPHTYIVTDMPFGTYHLSEQETVKAAARIMQEGGAHAVKLEGGDRVIDMIRILTKAGIPVVAHLGLTPQSVGVIGGYKVQGKTAKQAEQLMEDAVKCQEAGAFSVVLECVPRQLTEKIARSLNIPTIGIGAGLEADGQVLVYHDLIQYGVSRLPKFVKPYADVNEMILKGLSTYVKEVKDQSFPSVEYTFTMKEEERIALYGGKTE
jgi:3-methyl-2-oxobutanoate hydroxymethyltransferase